MPTEELGVWDSEGRVLVEERVTWGLRTRVEKAEVRVASSSVEKWVESLVASLRRFVVSSASSSASCEAESDEGWLQSEKVSETGRRTVGDLWGRMSGCGTSKYEGAEMKAGETTGHMGAGLVESRRWQLGRRSGYARLHPAAMYLRSGAEERAVAWVDDLSFTSHAG